jgi:hypothetical protein
MSTGGSSALVSAARGGFGGTARNSEGRCAENGEDQRVEKGGDASNPSNRVASSIFADGTKSKVTSHPTPVSPLSGYAARGMRRPSHSAF